MAITVPNGFEPRSYQRPVFDALARGCRRILLNWHRRSGKDRTALAALAVQMVERVGNYFYLLPTYAQARKTIWDSLDRSGRPFLDVFPAGLVMDKNETEQSLTLTNSSRLQLLGSDQVDRLRGVNFAGAVFSEFAWQDPHAWRVLSPVAVESGAWILFCSTPNGRNAFWQMYEAHRDDPTWYVSRLTIEDTRRDAVGEDGSPVIRPEDVAREIREGMPEELAAQEFYCTPASGLTGSYYGSLLDVAEKEGRIGAVPWDPAHLVHTAWDIGIGDSTAIVFAQRIGLEWRFVDHYEASGVGLSHYAKVLRELPYAYGQHIGPHDLAVQEFGSGQTRIEVARNLGIDFTLAPRLPVDEGVDAVRRLLPAARFDRTKCERLLQALGAYRRQWNDQTKMFSERPLHDWASHACDAMRVLATGYDDIDLENFKEPERAILDFNAFSYEKQNPDLQFNPWRT